MANKRRPIGLAARSPGGAAAFIALALVLAGGCVSPRVPHKLQDQSRPTVGILYYPPAEPKGGGLPVRPFPAATAWTDRAMREDLRRIGRARVDVVFVVLRLDEDDSRALGRVVRFAKVAETVSDAPGLALWLRAQSGGVSSRQVRQFVDRLVRLGGLDVESWYEVAGRPLLVVEGAAVGLERHPAFAFQRADGGASSWTPVPVDGVSAPRYGADGGQALVSGGTWNAETQRWEVPRRGGATFRKQFRQAVVRGPELVIVSSWNDFSRGDFLTPHTELGDKAFRRLRAETEWLAEQTHPPNPRPPTPTSDR